MTLSLRSRMLLALLAASSTGCQSENPQTDSTRSPSAADVCAEGSGRPVLLDATFTRGPGAPATETRSFSSGGDSLGTVCVHVVKASGIVDLNEARLFGPSDFAGNVDELSKDTALSQTNLLAVEIHGKPCKDGGPCAALRVRVLGATTSVPFIEAAALTRPDQCCSDPTCDKDAFRARGGVCEGDPRIRGPLPFSAPSKQGQ